MTILAVPPVADIAGLQGATMPARLGPHAAILDCRVLEREPEAGAALGLGVQEGAVLVADHLGTDPRLLEDVHGLEEQGLDVADVRRDLGQGRAAGELIEDRVEVVERVPDLVDRQLLRLAQLPGLGEGIGLEEESDLVARIEEVAVPAVPALAGLEHRPEARGIEPGQQLGHAGAQAIAGLGRDEALQDQVAVPPVGLPLLGSEPHGPFLQVGRAEACPHMRLTPVTSQDSQPCRRSHSPTTTPICAAFSTA